MTYNLGLFSIRNKEMLREKKVEIPLSRRLRTRIWQAFERNTYQTQSETGYWFNAIDNVPPGLQSAYGWESLEVTRIDEFNKKHLIKKVSLETFVLEAYSYKVFDAIELFWQENEDSRAKFQIDFNSIMIQEKCPWLLCDGYLFKMDSEFLATHVMECGTELLKEHGYAGPLDEFAEARKDLTAGSYKDAMHKANKSVESVLKIIENKEHAKPGELLHGVPEKFFSGLPEEFIKKLPDKLFTVLPFIRNELAGHGQGKNIVKEEDCKHMANLAVNLAGCFIVFLIQRQTELKPTADIKPSVHAAPDDVPF